MVSKSTFSSFFNYYSKGEKFSRTDLMRHSLLLSAPTAQRLIEQLLKLKNIKPSTDFKRHPLEVIYEVC